MKYIITEHILFYYHSGASQYSEYGWEAGIAQDIPPLTTDHWVELKLIVREPFSLTYCSSNAIPWVSDHHHYKNLWPAACALDGAHTSLFSSMHPAPLDHYHCFMHRPIPLKWTPTLQFFMFHLILTNTHEDGDGYTWPETMKKRNNHDPTQCAELKASCNVPPEVWPGYVATNALPETSD